MLSRIFWVGIAGIALVTGMLLQDGREMFAWGHEQGITRSTERAVEARVQRAIEAGFDKAEIHDSKGRVVNVSADARRALGAAVGELVDAETDLALLKMRDGSDGELRAATARRDAARATVDQLKSQIRDEGETPALERDAIREQIRAEIRESVRDATSN